MPTENCKALYSLSNCKIIGITLSIRASHPCATSMKIKSCFLKLALVVFVFTERFTTFAALMRRSMLVQVIVKPGVALKAPATHWALVARIIKFVFVAEHVPTRLVIFFVASSCADFIGEVVECLVLAAAIRNKSQLWRAGKIERIDFQREGDHLEQPIMLR